MTIRKLALATAAVSLATAPVAAQAAATTPERSTAPAAQEARLQGGFGPALIIIAIGALGMGLLLLLDDDDNDQPVSP